MFSDLENGFAGEEANVGTSTDNPQETIKKKKWWQFGRKGKTAYGERAKLGTGLHKWWKKQIETEPNSTFIDQVEFFVIPKAQWKKIASEWPNTFWRRVRYVITLALWAVIINLVPSTIMSLLTAPQILIEYLRYVLNNPENEGRQYVIFVSKAIILLLGIFYVILDALVNFIEFISGVARRHPWIFTTAFILLIIIDYVVVHVAEVSIIYTAIYWVFHGIRILFAAVINIIPKLITAIVDAFKNELPRFLQ